MQKIYIQQQYALQFLLEKSICVLIFSLVKKEQWTYINFHKSISPEATIMIEIKCNLLVNISFGEYQIISSISYDMKEIISGEPHL